MNELPLFPLHTVLFPGMPLGLHIFEERYRQLIGDCLRQETNFGVVLIARGHEALGPLAQPHLVGCTARIAQVQRMVDGRMNIIAIGQERFRIVALDQEHPYLTGRVEPYPLALGEQSVLNDAGRRLMPFVKRYLDLLADMSEGDVTLDELPGDPIALAYLAAMLLNVPSGQKQLLLAKPEADDLLADIHQLYRRELPLLQLMSERAEQTTEEPFSLN